MIGVLDCIACPVDRSEFDFTEVTLNSILRILSDCPPSSCSSGSDEIPLYILCLAWPIIFSHIISLFNLSLNSSIFPVAWKRALIRPLSKVRTPDSPSDARPITNLPEISKILERIVADQISVFLDEHNILNPRQSACQPFHSTQSAILRVIDDIKLGIDCRQVTIMILFDFSKAFDVVPHLNLLIKLKRLGFSM